uniref:NADP-dependent oxidoreductase domain-containing protein n=1 Tax=Acrobeloides nanus TaxID=290746 RepID=A0A914E0J4_9BILA
MEPKSGYIKANAISCNGCKNLQVAPKCYKQASECMAPPDTVGLTIDSYSYGSELQFTVPPIAKCQCINGVRYFWNAITPNVTTSVHWASENNQLAMNILSKFSCGSFCICDEAGECYQQFDDNSASYIEFIPYCSGESCHMYAVVYDERELPRYSPLKTLNGTVYRRNLDSNFDDSLIKAYSVTCNGCKYIHKKSICQGPTYIKKPGEIMERYPHFEYFDSNLGLLNMLDALTQEDIDQDWPGVLDYINSECNIYATLSEGEYNTFYQLCVNARDPAQLREALEAAIESGYRYIDTAQLYNNEHVIGEFLEDKIREGKLKRSDVFITSKGNYGNPRSDPANAKPLLIPHIDTWKVLEKYYRLGKLRSIGVSNFNKKQLQTLYDDAEIKPHNLQAECHITWPQHELFELCMKLGMTFTAYATLGSLGRLVKDPDEPAPLEEPLVKELAKHYNKTPAQRGISVIPKSVTRSRLQENIDIFDFKLTHEEMERFDCEVKTKQRIFTMEYATNHPWYPYVGEKCT